MDMGGIAGCIHLPLDDDGKVRMLSTMKHRGRDREGSHTIDDCTLMSTGRNHNGELLPTAERMGECYCICFDGCVFNRRELSRELGSVTAQKAVPKKLLYRRLYRFNSNKVELLHDNT